MSVETESSKTLLRLEYAATMNSCATRWSGVSTRMRLSTHGECRYWVKAGASGISAIRLAGRGGAFLGSVVLARERPWEVARVGSGRCWATASIGAASNQPINKSLDTDKGRSVFYTKIALAFAKSRNRRRLIINRAFVVVHPLDERELFVCTTPVIKMLVSGTPSGQIAYCFHWHWSHKNNGGNLHRIKQIEP